MAHACQVGFNHVHSGIFVHISMCSLSWLEVYPVSEILMLSMYVCMYVGMYVCMYACMHVWMAC